MTREEFVTRWRTHQSEWARIGALVDGARVREDVLQDFEAVTRAEDDAELGLSEAAAESGYSSDHLRRLTGKASCRPIARGAVCSSAPAIYRGSQPHLGFPHTIPSRMLDKWSVSARTGGDGGRRSGQFRHQGQRLHQ